jgi:hypothetical protein
MDLALSVLRVMFLLCSVSGKTEAFVKVLFF